MCFATPHTFWVSKRSLNAGKQQLLPVWCHSGDICSCGGRARGWWVIVLGGVHVHMLHWPSRIENSGTRLQSASAGGLFLTVEPLVLMDKGLRVFMRSFGWGINRSWVTNATFSTVMFVSVEILKIFCEFTLTAVTKTAVTLQKKFFALFSSTDIKKISRYIYLRIIIKYDF